MYRVETYTLLIALLYCIILLTIDDQYHHALHKIKRARLTINTSSRTTPLQKILYRETGGDTLQLVSELIDSKTTSITSPNQNNQKPYVS